ncbi:TonB-dependent receptor plug domain-containing protein [Alteromonas facilis]|uniref:TonB-dependent receptor plug domain-containing protein n=1 Tax=Alteromonas facilis TaxID=2048004 RepID=UPI000C294B06|nr:TonB-dependent receptor [Alteromonas facilis]
MKTQINPATLAVAFGALLCPNIALSQSNSTQLTTGSIEHISVLGSRSSRPLSTVSSSVYVLDELSIRQSGQQFLVDILRGMPGISVSRSGSVGGLTEIRMRGAETNHLLVMIDGVVVNDESQGGLFDFAHLTTDNVTRVELLSGPQSALWGSGAVAGVLSITTAQHHNSSTKFSASLGNHQQRSVGFSTHQRSNEITWNASLSHLTTDGENVSRVGNEDDGYDNTTLHAGLVWQASEQETISLNIRSLDYRNEYDNVDYYITGLPSDSDNVTDGKQLSARLGWQFQSVDNIWQHNVQAHISVNENQNYAAKNDEGGSEARRFSVSYVASYSPSASYQANLGIETVEHKFDQYGPIVFADPNQTQHMDTQSVFTDAFVKATRHITLNGSARWDQNSDFNNQSSFRFGPHWQLTPRLKLYASYSKAVRNPTFTERFGYYPGSFVGNPNLTPETVKSAEIGSRLQLSQHTDVTLNWYKNKLTDEINGFVFAPEQNAYTAQNSTAESERKGLELSASQAWRTGSLKAYYSYVDAEENSNSASQIIELRRPQHTASIVLALADSNDRWFANIKADYTGTRFDQYFPPYPQAAQRIKLSAYWLVNASVGYTLSDSASIQLSAHNLFNQDYEDIVGYVGKGRQVNASVTYSL